MTDIKDPSRPKLHSFLAARELDHFQGAALLGCSGEYVRRMCLAFDDPRRCVPSERMRRQFSEKTGGDVGVDDWDANWAASGAEVAQ